MPRGKSTTDSDFVNKRRAGKRREALEILLEARENLLSRLAEDVLSNRDAILDAEGQNGLFSFEFQELEDRYSARLNALNAILENLEYRRPRIAHHVESFSTTREDLAKSLNDLLGRFEQWDVVDIDVTALPEDELLVVVGFTTDEWEE